MKCDHCSTDFHASAPYTSLQFYNEPRDPKPTGDGVTLSFSAVTYVCSFCGGAHIDLRYGPSAGNQREVTRVFPRRGSYAPAPPQVPQNIAQDYAEANEVLSISPKASAALSRRCLQAVLASQGYSGRDLLRQIEAAIAETDASKSLPTSIRDNIDAVRNFGNFSAHPITELTSLQVVDVEEGEAQWCIEILIDLFDHYYVALAKSAARRSALAAKLGSAGKPPMR